MFGNDREGIRRQYLQAWSLHREGLPLDPLQTQIAQILMDHPEYQGLVEDEAALEREYLPEYGETNPFLHMGLHLAIRDQIKTDRPAGIQGLYQRLLMDCAGDGHEAEHHMIDCLAEGLWQAQRDGTAPDETAYLRCLKQRTHNGKK